MNLFALHDDPDEAAIAHCDQHVFKMCVEAAQLLSTATSVLLNHCDQVPSKNGKRMLTKYKQLPGLYKPTHHNHPSCKWLRVGRGNAKWACHLGLALHDECRVRGLKTPDAARAVFATWLGVYQSPFPNIPRTPFDIAINPILHPTVVIDHSDPVGTYRDYYRKSKAVFPKKGPATWTNRKPPEWWHVQKGRTK